MSRLFFRLSLLAFTSWMMAAPTLAIVIRHDVPDAAYLALESDWPAQFPLFRTREGHPDCIATLIAPRWAVTARHCTQTKVLTRALKAREGGHKVLVAGRHSIIDRVVVPPRGASARGPDIALLRLANPIAHVTPVPLYRGRDEVGQLVIIPGGGRTGNGESGLGVEDGRFRVAENRVDFIEDGKIWWKFDSPGANSRALTLEGISGPGDSGGPALFRTPAGLAIAGISSAQDTKDGPEGLYGVEEAFVRVSEFADWIDRVIAEDRR